MSAVAKVSGFIVGLVFLAARILGHGFDGLCLALTLSLLGVLIAKPIVDAIDDTSTLPRLSDPRPFPHEGGRQ